MRRASFIVGDNGVRPVSAAKDTCAYCQQPRGSEHLADCVIRRRTVVVRLTIEYVTTVQDEDGPPPEHALFHWNEGTYCTDNALEEILERVNITEEKADDLGLDVMPYNCTCNASKIEYVREATEDDENAWGVRVKDLEG